MKRFVLLVLAIMVFLAACGGGVAPAAVPAATPMPASAAPADVAFRREVALQLFSGAEADMAWEMPEAEFAVGAAGTTYGGDDSFVMSALSAQQIIYHAHATVQTTAFDESIEQVHGLIERYHGFLQHSNISGQDLHAIQGGWFSGRWASFSIRVPAGSYQAMLDALEDVGVVSQMSTTATNVTAQYADIESRLNSLRVQEERILDLLEHAGSLTDLLELEARLGSLIQQIEFLTADRNHLDAQISCSTIDLQISEVEAYTHVGQNRSGISGAFSSSVAGLYGFGVGLVLFLVALVPWLIVAAVVGVPVFFFIRRRRRKRRENTPEV